MAAAGHRKQCDSQLEKYRLAYPVLIEPYVSVDGPGYDSLEQGFIASITWPKDLDTLYAMLESGDLQLAPRDPDPLRDLRNAIRSLADHPRSTRPFFEALERFRLTALRENEWERLNPPLLTRREEHELLTALRLLMWQRVNAWHSMAESGRRAERIKAAARLRQFGKALIPETRGRGEVRGLGRWSVCDFYGRNLFRLLRTIRLLDAWPWPATQEERIQSACRACGLAASLAVPYLRSLINQRHGRIPTPEQTVRDWTAAEFNMEPKTVMNILDSYRRPADLRRLVSRK